MDSAIRHTDSLSLFIHALSHVHSLLNKHGLGIIDLQYQANRTVDGSSGIIIYFSIARDRVHVSITYDNGEVRVWVAGQPISITSNWNSRTLKANNPQELKNILYILVHEVFRVSIHK